MTPNARFTEFLTDIEPSSTTKTNASSTHTKLRATLRGDEIFEPLHRHTSCSPNLFAQTIRRDRPQVPIRHRPPSYLPRTTTGGCPYVTNV